MAQLSRKDKNQTTSKSISNTPMALSWYQSMSISGDLGHEYNDDEHFLNAKKENHIGIVTELCIALAVFC